MKIKITILMLFLAAITSNIFAQTNLKEYKVGHVFYVSLPDYMNKTIGINSSSTLQYKNEVKDIYGFIIEDNKEELALAELNYATINEFCEDFAKDFLKDEEKRNLSIPQYQKNGSINFAEFDATYYDKDAKTEIYYLVGIVETKFSYYKVLSYTSKENKDKFKADFQKILYSLKD
jgi:hypothetical protein